MSEKLHTWKDRGLTCCVVEKGDECYFEVSAKNVVYYNGFTSTYKTAKRFIEDYIYGTYYGQTTNSTV